MYFRNYSRLYMILNTQNPQTCGSFKQGKMHTLLLLIFYLLQRVQRFACEQHGSGKRRDAIQSCQRYKHSWYRHHIRRRWILYVSWVQGKSVSFMVFFYYWISSDDTYTYMIYDKSLGTSIEYYLVWADWMILDLLIYTTMYKLWTRIFVLFSGFV